MDLTQVITNMTNRTVSIDFDGVLAEYDGWKGEGVMGEPYPGVAEFLAEINSLGFEIVVHTVRKTQWVWGWLGKHCLDRYVEAVTSIKPPAFAYIDDRAICHRGDFSDTLLALRSFRAHWDKH